MSIILVGELNPHGADPRCALFCEPPNSAGGRMQRLVCGLRRCTYLALPRANLCEGRWSMSKAREKAGGIRFGGHTVVVMLGRKVAEAFGHGDADPFSLTIPFTIRSPQERRKYVAIPHPSGLCRRWNEPGAFERARDLLRTACPEVPWGELDADELVFG